MYYLEFGNSELPLRLYIFRTEDGETFADPVDWVTVEGDSDPVLLRIDPVKPNGIFTPIIKQSIEVLLYRQDDVEFLDLIAAEEGEFMAVVLEDGELDVDGDGDIEITGDNPKLLFKGILTNENYSENYLPTSIIKLTFHDRLGDLASFDFFTLEPEMKLNVLLAQLFDALPCNQQLYLEFPYKINTTDLKNLRHPGNIVLEVSNYLGKNYEELLLDILNDFKLQLICDFDALGVGLESTKLSASGRVRIRFPFYHAETNNLYFAYSFKKEGYDLISEVTETLFPLELGSNTFPIIGRSGAWQLTRKAKYVEGSVRFGLKEGLINPPPFEDRMFEDVDHFEPFNDFNYPLKHVNWSGLYDTGTTFNQILAALEFSSDTPRAFAAFLNRQETPALLIGDARGSNKTGLMTSGITVTKVTGTLDLKFSIFNNSAFTNIGVTAYANFNGVLYEYNRSATAWQSPAATFTGWTVIDIGDKEITELSITDIPHLTAPVTGDRYSLFFVFNNIAGSYAAGENMFLTAFTLTYNEVQLLPSKLTIRTTVVETRRKPVVFESKFYNLPAISNAMAYYHSGILATGLDVYSSGVLAEEESVKIHALATLEFEGENATMLVHATDIVGINSQGDTWRFSARVRETDDGEAVISSRWDDLIYVCEREVE